jgi:NADH dehydrogenase
VPPRVLIVGGGFGGLWAARGLRRAPVQVTLIDRRNFHLFQPLLYQVATGGLAAEDIAAPLRSVLRHQANARVLLGEVVDLDPSVRRVLTRDGPLDYDELILATGVRHHYFGHDGWAELAPGLKTAGDALRLRGRILGAFEAAERAPDAAAGQASLTFVVVGGGPTGVELAGAIGELCRHTLRHDFRAFRPGQARVVLVEAAERVLPGYPAALSAHARRALERLGVSVETGAAVTAIDPDRVTLCRQGVERSVAARTVVWAAGVEASPLGALLAQRTGAGLDRAGRVRVAADLSVPGHPEIRVIGDLALVEGPDGQALAGVAPVAMQQGAYVARALCDRLRGRATPPFAYRHRGSLAVIGRAAAVADLGRARFHGYPAWLLWLFVHIMYLVEFGNRLVVLVQWAHSYVTRKQGARLIPEPDETGYPNR